ncbi:MAG: hypothetical protein HFH41_04105 [Lachnospiraceae bacterium]|nr:hypothetical protein [Lachnospiraceae bacterium]
MIVKWTKKSNKTTYDITQAVGAVTWSGSTTQAARQASITVLNAPNDPNLKKLKLNLAVGDVIALYEGGKNIFYGEIQTSEKKGEIGTVTYNATDLLGHLLRISYKGKYKKKTAERITRLICKKYGIQVGTIVKTKKMINKIIIDGNSVYDTIMIAYTKASKGTGKKYMCYMKGKKFCTKVKGMVVSGYSLDENRNIVSSSYEETIENMVDKVLIYNEKGKQIGVVKNAGHLKRYGLYQEIYTKEQGVNAKRAAKNMLAGIEKKVNVDVIEGNVKCTAGNGVKVHDKATGLDGLFWIDSDTHTWEGGVYTMSLELNFKNIMDKKTV